jgi:hypothetical protein
MNATASIDVSVALDHVFTMISDPLEYRRMDPRVTELSVVTCEEDLIIVRVRGFLLSSWLDSSALARVRMSERRRLDIELEPGSISLPASLIVEGFKTTLVTEETRDGTRVTRNEVLALRSNPLSAVAVRLAGGWLQRYLDTIAMPRLKQVIEARHRRGESPTLRAQ